MKYKKIKLKDGTTRDEHRLLVEIALGRKLFYNEVVHHKDGNKANNSLDNLEILSRSEHSKMHMLEAFKNNPERQRKFIDAKTNPPKGCKSPSSKLTIEQVKEIRTKLKTSKVNIRQLARDYGVTHPTILAIKNDKSYIGKEYYP